jgi:hypothetical protein
MIKMKSLTKTGLVFFIFLIVILLVYFFMSLSFGDDLIYRTALLVGAIFLFFIVAFMAKKIRKPKSFNFTRQERVLLDFEL